MVTNIRSSLFATAAMLIMVSSAASEPRPYGGIMCDTATQAESFASKWNGTNGEQLVEAINNEAGKATACVVGVWYIEQQEGEPAKVTTDMGVWQVEPVVVFAKQTPQGVVATPFPFPQFTPHLVEKSQKTEDLFKPVANMGKRIDILLPQKIPWIFRIFGI